MRSAIPSEKWPDAEPLPSLSKEAGGNQWPPEAGERVSRRRPSTYQTRAGAWAAWFEENVQPGMSSLVPEESNLSYRQIRYSLEGRGIKFTIHRMDGGRLVCRK